MEEDAMTCDALDEALHGGVGDAVLAGDLAVSGAGDLGVEDGGEQLGAAQAVGGGEGL
jgi:hypothetical protein